MTAERRLAAVETALSPTELVVGWLTEAHAHGGVDAFVRSGLADEAFIPSGTRRAERRQAHHSVMPRRRVSARSVVRRTALELALLAIFVFVSLGVGLPLLVEWAHGFHFQTPGATEPASSSAGGPGRVYGTITAGPVCPVERLPAQSQCAPRPVAGAIIVAKDPTGDELGRATSQADGTYILPLATRGTVVISALPVAGLLGVPAPVSLTIADPLSFERLDLEYDTGIR